MVSAAPSNLRQLLRRTQRLVKFLALLLRTGILPIRTEGMTEHTAALFLVSGLQLVKQSFGRIQTSHQSVSILVPKHSAMLHSSTRYALDLCKIETLFFQP